MRLRAAVILGLGLTATAAAPVRAQDSVRGDGNRVTQARIVPPFSAVELRIGLDVEVTEGPAQAVAVTVDGNLQPNIDTRVEGDRLIIESHGDLTLRRPGKVTLSVPVLRAFALRGSGDVRIAGADATRDVNLALAGSGTLSWSGNAGEVRAALDGSGNVELSGQARSLWAAINGSGDVLARGLTAESARLAIGGSGNMEATLGGGRLSAAISGSGDITWWGNAREASAAVSGAGDVRHR